MEAAHFSIVMIIAYQSTRCHFSADSDFIHSHSNRSMCNLLMSNFQAQDL